MEFPFFEYTRFRLPAQGFLEDAASVKQQFSERAKASNGHLFGCWRSMVGLGLARDEGIALSAWRTRNEASSAPPLDQGAYLEQQQHLLEATVRPTSDSPPTCDGAYVFRWFHLQHQDWPAFRDLSDAAWPNMESVFDVNICGFWKSLEVSPPATRVLLLTRYADLSVWEASRWWSKPVAAADASMGRFKQRNQLIEHTVAYPSMRID
jgi:hypothetical protein